METQPSPHFTLNVEDLKKIGVGAGIALGGALLTYFTTVVTNTDFGEWTPVVTAGWSVFVNIVRKYFRETK